jgi:quercetin dioxygenase-like cupin family protein
MTEVIEDPVLRQRYTFWREGETLVVEIDVGSGSGVPKHFHPHLEERWKVLEGEFTFWVGHRKDVVGPGHDTVVVEPRVIHAFKNTSTDEGRIRAEVEPAMEMEQALRAGVAMAHRGVFTAGGMPRGLRGTVAVAEFLERYQESIVFTFPPRIVQRLIFGPLLWIARLAGRRATDSDTRI